MQHSVVIVGGGLAGLAAARMIDLAGIGFHLVEARERLGGRVFSADASGQVSNDGFDLGPSWFWPGMQPGLAKLVEDLGLPTFAQNSDGDVVIERRMREKPQRYQGFRQEPQSMRLVGGSSALITALEAELPGDRLQRGTRATHAVLGDDGVVLQVTGADGFECAIHARYVIFALPPRLLEATVSFTPALDTGTARHWRATATWMAPHAKFFALYDHAFWRDAGLSGAAQSMVGPLSEIHDATTASGSAGLFGFIGIGADERHAIGEEAVTAACVEQLGRIFGLEARRPRATLFKDWAADPLTATSDDRVAGQHPSPDRRPWVSGAWQGRISLAGSETSATDPGYLAGAVEAAQRAVMEMMEASRPLVERR